MALVGTSVHAQNLVAEVGFGLSTTRFDYSLGHANADLFGGTLGLSYDIPLIEGTIGFAPGLQFGYFTKSDVNAFNITPALHLTWDSPQGSRRSPLELNMTSTAAHSRTTPSTPVSMFFWVEV